jgi:hypothetical protein
MPKLFVQGDRDEVIPAELARRLYASAQEPKSFWVVEGAGHNDILEQAGPAYRERLQSFYISFLPLPRQGTESVRANAEKAKPLHPDDAGGLWSNVEDHGLASIQQRGRHR